MLFEEIVYGPIHSRRLGVSLGVNVMPTHGKLCTFDCIYCECGFNSAMYKPILPSREEIREAMERKLLELLDQHIVPNVITFSGNGEPTLHPDFEGIIDDTIELRNRYCRQAAVTVLSNSTQLGRADVVRALRRCDNRILKLDAADTQLMRMIDAPVNHDLTSARIEELLAQFDGDFTLQTIFLRGVLPDGRLVDNTKPEYLSSWYRAVERLHPKQVMIYVIDRKTPVETLEKISSERMEQIAAPLRDKGFDVQITV